MIREQSQKVMSAADMLYGPGGQPSGGDHGSSSETSETHTLHTETHSSDTSKSPDTQGGRSPFRREVPICKGP